MEYLPNTKLQQYWWKGSNRVLPTPTFVTVMNITKNRKENIWQIYSHAPQINTGNIITKPG